MIFNFLIYSKNRRSQSIIPTHQPELDVHRDQFMKKPCPSDTVCWKDTLSPKRGGDPSVDGAEGGGAAGSLPRTLSTSVLRIKHRRTFWERCAR